MSSGSDRSNIRETLESGLRLGYSPEEATSIGVISDIGLTALEIRRTMQVAEQGGLPDPDSLIEVIAKNLSRYRKRLAGDGQG